MFRIDFVYICAKLSVFIMHLKSVDYILFRNKWTALTPLRLLLFV